MVKCILYFIIQVRFARSLILSDIKQVDISQTQRVRENVKPIVRVKFNISHYLAGADMHYSCEGWHEFLPQ
jgi:hypothetical protein